MIRTRTQLRAAGIIFFGLVSGYAISVYWGRTSVSAQGPQPKFTATIVRETFHGNSSMANIRDEITHAQRSDGSVASATKRTINIPSFSKKPELIERNEILDASQRTRVALYPGLGRKSTTPFTAQAAASMRQAATEGCRPSEAELQYDSSPPDSLILGIPVVSVVRENTEENGTQSVSRFYLAADLNCFALQLELMQKDNTGAVLSRQIRRAVTFAWGAPDPSLFHVPAGYVESPPSAIYDEDSERRGKLTDTERAHATKTRGDARYYELRKH